MPQVNTSLDLYALYLSRFELVGHLFKCTPLNSIVLIDPFDDPLMHQNDLRLTTNLRMDADWKHELVVLPVTELKLLLPESFNVMRVDEA